EVRDYLGHSTPASPGLVSAMAWKYAVSGRMPDPESVSVKPVHVPDPRRAHPPRWAVPRHVLIPGFLVGAPPLLYPVDDRTRVNPDGDMFAAAKSATPGKGQAPLLRTYLVDPRNTRHRDEAQKLLDANYDQSIARFKGKGGDAELNAAFAQVIASLKTLPAP